MAVNVPAAAITPARPASAGAVMCPFDLSVDVIDRMLNFEIADDPTYSGLEVQVFDDDTHGRGMVVLLTRRADDHVDCYRQAGLRLDPSEYEIGGGIGAWLEATISPARFEITPHGVDLHVRFCDTAGRTIEVHVDDRSGRRRKPAMLLAPFGAGIQHPRSLMLVWMRRFDLVRSSGRKPEIRIDGQARRSGALPAGWLHRRRLIKYAADLAVVRLNSRCAATLNDVAASGDRASELLELDATRTSIVAVTATSRGHTARLELDSPLPLLQTLAAGVGAVGGWRLAVDATVVAGGRWRASRRADAVDVSLDVTKGWRPAHLPPLMRIVTTVAPIFRTWPTTYRWNSCVRLDGSAVMTARWVRTGTDRGDSYRRLTGTSTTDP